MSEQRNCYKGKLPRSWIRLQLLGADGAEQEFELLADTGCPCPIIVSEVLLGQFSIDREMPINTNFGRLPGGTVRLTIPELSFDEKVLAYGSDKVIAMTTQSSASFKGLAGLPLLRMFEFGGDADWFWLRRS